MIVTQGDTASWNLRAKDADGNYIVLTGATLSTLILQSDGSTVLTLDNSKHAINSDQVANPGSYSVNPGATDLDNCLGNDKDLLTQITLAGKVTTLRLKRKLTILPARPTV